MKRAHVLSVVVLSGTIVAAVAQLTAQQPPAGAPPAGAPGQGRPGGPPGGAPPGGGRGGGGVEAARKIVDNLYWVPGAGGNTAIFVTGNGVVLVDTKLANNGQAILDQVKSVTDKPVTHIINTHTHGDHNGSNVFFPATVEIVTQENTKANMEKMPAFADAANKHGLPDRTFKERETLLSGNDAIDLYYYGAAHTNGDAFVVFRNARVMHAGDAFANKGLPNIDGNNGGSGLAWGETIGKASAGIKNVQTVITGHNTMTTMTWQDFVDYGEFNRLYAQHARESLKAGKTPEQAAMDLKLPDKFKDYQLTGGRGGPGGNFGRLFEELKAAPK